MLWLEEAVREVLRRVDAKDPLVEDCQNKYEFCDLLTFQTSVVSSVIPRR